MKRLHPFLLLVLSCLFLWAATTPALADNVSYTVPDGMTLDDMLTVEHRDGGEYKGWFDLTVTNSGDTAWGDFHFEIYEVHGFGSVENVDFIVSPGFEPTGSQYMTWSVDNDAVGATLDLFFYGDPVNPGETANFSVYTANTDQLDFFGVRFYPTPVPLPGALWLLGSGLLGLAGIRKHLNKN